MTKNNKNNNHPLHKLVGDCVEEYIKNNKHVEFILIKDPAVGTNNGKKQLIPLCHNKEKSNAEKYCNVDLIIKKSNKIFVIIEIEESDIKPTQICGKFLASALSNYYIHYTEKEPIEMNENVLFIQILDNTEAKKNGSKKYIQGENLENSIRYILPIGKITNYNLFYCSKENFECEKIIKEIKKFMK